jgi:ribosomal protein S18 acetylase RimI-like enzyme
MPEPKQIRYPCTTEGITSQQLEGFFEGWPNPPSPETHLRILEGSDHVVLAVDDGASVSTGAAVVGFITAISDGVLTAHIPLLEVLPHYQGIGIGSELVRRMLEQLGDLYAIDLLCDTDVQPFYARLGMRPAAAMMVRDYDRQSCSLQRKGARGAETQGERRQASHLLL